MWGYDGVAPFAPHAAYGTPDELRALVDEAHGVGLAVLLDVVYNHLGPAGNDLAAYSRTYFRDAQTGWGEAPDFTQPAMRALAVASARYWLEAYQLDGLRLDAVHALFDDSERHILREITDAAHALGRPVIVIAEDERNEPALVERLGVDGIWADDFHHAVHATLTGERDGYYAAFSPGAGTIARVIERFQQLSGPVMAKGVEDTAIYRYARLVCLNEVGCDPARFGAGIEELHRHNARALAAFPLTMTTLTTHDTKRSEDVRTRIAVLSEEPEAWAAQARRWRAIAARYTTRVRGEIAPAGEDLYHLFQTVIGVWPHVGDEPGLEGRLVAYMHKVVREAKVHTSWTTPEEAYEQATERCVRGLLADATFVGEVRALVARLAPAGACNSLAQKAIALASPGVPDTYQGTELWDLSLVDPDNRRPVDFARRRALLAELRGRTIDATLAHELVAGHADGRIKLHVIRAGLDVRRALPLLFLEGGYRPLVARGSVTSGGEAADHVIAFEREHGGERLVCVTPRLPLTLCGGRPDWPLGVVWGDAVLDVGDGAPLVDVFTGAAHAGHVLPLADVLGVFPVAWLRGPAAVR